MKINEFFLSVCTVLLILQLIVLSCLYDYVIRFDYAKVKRFDSLAVGTLVVDTIHAEEIEIFPLCDLNGDLVY